MGWISVKERFPKKGEIVLIFAAGFYDLALHYKDGEFWDRHSGSTLPDIAFWSRLPKLPEST